MENTGDRPPQEREILEQLWEIAADLPHARTFSLRRSIHERLIQVAQHCKIFTDQIESLVECFRLYLGETLPSTLPESEELQSAAIISETKSLTRWSSEQSVSSNKNPETHPRTEMMWEILKDMNILPLRCRFLVTPSDSDMLPYNVIVIPELDRSFFISDFEGNATYILYTSKDIEQFLGASKERLRSLHARNLVRRIVWQDTEKWKTLIRESLEDEPEISPEPKVLSSFTTTDQQYYVQEYVRHDLEAFAEVIDDISDVQYLTTGNMTSKDVETVCCSGEKVSGKTYMRRASKALGLYENGKFFLAKTLTKLLLIAFPGEYCDIQDKEYFYDPQKVRQDVLGYSRFYQQLDPRKVQIYSLSLFYTFLCANGEEAQLGRFLKRAGVTYGFAKKQSDIKYYSQYNEIWQKLCDIAGF